ncbi:MAG: hypothetical protein HYX91_02115 [Chloroflexi bacterium]|nr:hypothetical protein [Chloroflexota bacterium]
MRRTGRGRRWRGAAAGLAAVMVVALIVGTGLVSQQPVQASAGVHLWVDADNVTAGVQSTRLLQPTDDSFSVVVFLDQGTNADGVSGVDVHLTYDPAKIKVASVVNFGLPAGYTALNYTNTNNVAGMLSVSRAKLSAPFTTVSFTIVRVTFDVQAAFKAAPGSTDINFSTSGVDTTTDVRDGNENPALAPGGLHKAAITMTGPATSLLVSGIADPVTAGSASSVTVTARDASGNTAGYTGTVQFSSSDTQASLPGDYTFQAGDNGVKTFAGLVLRTAGEQSVTVTDTLSSNITGTQSAITVAPAAANKLAFNPPPASPVTAGAVWDTFKVEIRDQFDNLTTSTANVTVTPSIASFISGVTDKAAVSGIATFNGLAFNVPGTITVTASSAGLTPATSGNITVTPSVAPSWTEVTLPGTTGNVLLPGSDVVDIAVAPDGDTIYAVTGGATVYKSTNRGDTWYTIATSAGGNPAINASLVAVAPDNANIVVIADAASAKVYASTSGGSTWGVLGVPQEANGAAANTLTDLVVSAASAGTNFIAVSGTEAGDVGNVWYFNLGAQAPVWKETNSLSGFSSATAPGAVGAIAFSPNFASDQVLTALTYDNTSKDVRFQLFSLGPKIWNANMGFIGYPLLVASATSGTGLTAASIALAPDYLGSDDTLRLAFVGLDITGDVARSGIYRLLDTTVKQMKDSVGINSVAFNAVTLVAGETAKNAVWSSATPLVSTPTVTPTTSLKRPGSSASDSVVVAWAGNDVVAGTTGDDSAFSISTDGGAAFNDISLIDASLDVLEDVAVSTYGGVVYLVTRDAENDHSVWRKAGDNWQRVLNLQADSGDYIVRLSPDSADVAYLARKGTQTLYYTRDGGMTRWFTRTAPDNLVDLAVESTDVAYLAVDSANTVRKTTNGGFIWATARDTELVAGNIATIAALGNGQVIVGGAAGYVSYSSDGNLSWTAIPYQIEPGALLTQTAATGLNPGGYIYAATSKASTTVKRWQIGVSTAWTDLAAPVPAGYGATGVASWKDVLYVLASDGNDSTLLWLSGGTWQTADSAGEVFNFAPSALKLSSAWPTLWAIDTSAGALYSFTLNTAWADVMVDAPAYVSPGSTFTASLKIQWVEDLDAASYIVSANRSVLQLVDVTSGNISGTGIPVSLWNENPAGSGSYSVVQNLDGFQGVSGEGVLAVLHFKAVGDLGTSTWITVSDGVLSNNLAQEIQSVWAGQQVNISILPGDANGDGKVNSIDITKVERIIVGLDDATPGADANQDGKINAVDVTKVERIIAGLD